MRKEKLLDKLKSLRTRIEEWCEENGYENMGNYIERYHTSKSGQKTITYKRSDWEFVYDMYHLIYNDNPYFYGRDTFNQLNELWYKYKLDD